MGEVEEIEDIYYPILSHLLILFFQNTEYKYSTRHYGSDCKFAVAGSWTLDFYLWPKLSQV